MKRLQFGIRLLLLVIALLAAIFASFSIENRTMRSIKSPLIVELKEQIRELEIAKQLVASNGTWQGMDSKEVSRTLTQKRQQLTDLEQ